MNAVKINVIVLFCFVFSVICIWDFLFLQVHLLSENDDDPISCLLIEVETNLKNV